MSRRQVRRDAVLRRRAGQQALPPEGFVASAARVAGTRRIRQSIQRHGWQTEAWTFFDSIGEFRYSHTWLARAGSRAELSVQAVGPDGEWADVRGDHSAAAYLKELLDGCGGQAQFLYTVLLHLGVPGESYIIGEDVMDAAGQRVVGYNWFLVEAGELDTSADPYRVTDPETGEKRDLGKDSLILRVWRPHPRDRAAADSPSRAVLPVLREIENVSKHIAATVDSRLAGNGLLLLPREVSLTTPDQVTVPGDSPLVDGKDPFMATFIESMVTPISDRDSAGAVVPVIVRVPGEHLAQIRHLTFGTQFDAQAEPLRQAAVKRMALGLDTPPEQILGMGDASHWSAWNIEESTVKTAIEPALKIVADALTMQFLNPMMKLQPGVNGPTLFRVVAKVDRLILRPNRAEDAVKLYSLGLLGPETVREACGFDEGDAPTLDELRMALAIDLVRMGKIDPETGRALMLPSTAQDRPPEPGNPAQPVIPGRPNPAADTGGTPSTSPAPTPTTAGPGQQR